MSAFSIKFGLDAFFSVVDMANYYMLKVPQMFNFNSKF